MTIHYALGFSKHQTYLLRVQIHPYHLLVLLSSFDMAFFGLVGIWITYPSAPPSMLKKDDSQA